MLYYFFLWWSVQRYKEGHVNMVCYWPQVSRSIIRIDLKGRAGFYNAECLSLVQQRALGGREKSNQIILYYVEEVVAFKTIFSINL